jgi:hypothetical protein
MKVGHRCVVAALFAAIVQGCGSSSAPLHPSPDGGDSLAPPDGGDALSPTDFLTPQDEVADALPDLGLPEVPGDRTRIGAECSAIGGVNQLVQGTCGLDQLCITPGQGAPGGYCTAACTSNACPAGSACVQNGGGSLFCLAKCLNAKDCRAGYDCASDGRGANVCAPAMMGEPVPPVGAKPDGTACTTPEVKAPGTGERTFGANVGPISQHGNSLIEAEDFIAVSHGDLVVGFNDLATGIIGFATSHDDGAAFTYQGSLPTTTTFQSDPTVVVDAAGIFYMAWVGFDARANMPSNMRVYVAKSTDHGASFSAGVPASDPADYVDGRSFLDKPWIALSPTDGTVYVSYTTVDLAQQTNAVKMTRSHDKAASFETPSITLNSAARDNGRNLVQPVVDAAGDVHAVWAEINRDSDQFGSTQNAIYYTRLPAGAGTVIPDVKVTSATDSVVYDDPSIAVRGSRVHVGFVAGTPDGAWNVMVASSSDGGATFGTSVKANDDGAACATHFHQQIAVDDDGHLHMVWFDNRYKTGNVMYARSVDQGATWSPNEFVNDRGFEFATARDQATWLGDYLGLVVSGKTIYCAWTDPRLQGASHIYFAKGTLP